MCLAAAWPLPWRLVLRVEEPADDRLCAMTSSGLVTASLSSSSAQVVRRFAVPVRHLAFWIVAWSAFVSAEVWVLAEFLVNGPVVPLAAVLVVFRIV